MKNPDNQSAFETRDEAETPLAPQERDRLIPSWITYRRELNEVEQTNIAAAVVWAYNGIEHRDLLGEPFVLELHKRMLGDVWKWAGAFRTTERNLGAYWPQIPIEVRVLLDDAKVWIQKKTYSRDELAVRFHHRLVTIHPFANGNGRHARLMADLIVTQLGGERFSWSGGVNLAGAAEVRKRYIEALKKADKHDPSELIAFARS